MKFPLFMSAYNAGIAWAVEGAQNIILMTTAKFAIMGSLTFKTILAKGPQIKEKISPLLSDNG